MKPIFDSNELIDFQILTTTYQSDRSGLISDNIKILDQLEETPSTFGYSFEEVMVKNLETLIKDKTDVYLMFSGGKDSTLLLLLLEEIIGDRKLSIITSAVANRLNPSAFRYIMKKYPIVYHRVGDNTLETIMKSGGFIISGHGADATIHDLYMGNEPDVSSYFNMCAGYTRSSVDEYMELMEKVSTIFGSEFKTADQFVRARNIVLDWQGEQLQVGMIAGYGKLYENFGSPFLMPLNEQFVRYNFDGCLLDPDFYYEKKIIKDLISKRQPCFIPSKNECSVGCYNRSPYGLFSMHRRCPEIITSDGEYIWNR